MDEIDATVLNYAEIKALASGNPLLLERANLEAEVQQLHVLKQGYLRKKYGLEDYLASYPTKNAAMQKALEGMRR